MEARDNSFDLDMIHSKATPTPTPTTKPHPMHRQYSMQQQATPPQLQSHFQSQFQSRQPAGYHPPRQRASSEHWLSSSSFSLSTQGSRPAREHFPLRHQPLSYPQSRPHSYASSSAFSRPAAAAAAYSHHSQSATTSFATPPSRHRSPRPDYEWSASTAQAKIDAVTHAIRNKIIVEEDEEDILSTDRFY